MTPDRTKYLRYYKRDKKGKPWLNDLEEEAARRRMTLQQIVDALLEEIVRRQMTHGVLNGRPRRIPQRRHSGFDCNNTDTPSGDPSPY